MASPVLLVLGAGPKIGQSVAKSFTDKGYKVALASRSAEEGMGEDGHYRVKVDLQNPEGLQDVFEKVGKAVGIPSVVVYNAAARVPYGREDPLSSISVDDFNKEFAVNAASAFFAAKEAVRGFKQLPESASRTFIFTGNKLNTITLPNALSHGMGKSAVAHIIHGASIAYAPKGYRFYYVDERLENGDAAIPVNGPAAGQTYLELSEKKEQAPWHYTFVREKGFVKFDEAANWADAKAIDAMFQPAN